MPRPHPHPEQDQSRRQANLINHPIHSHQPGVSGLHHLVRGLLSIHINGSLITH